MSLTGAQSALAAASKDLTLGDPKSQKPLSIHERARQQKNYENMRKMLNQKKGSLSQEGGKSPSKSPFDEEDIGKRFALLK